jgi:hypothetical protein
MPFSMSSEYTLLEVAKSIGADGRQLALVDTLAQHAPFIEEGYWTEADDFNSHHFLQVLSEPMGSDTRINRGYAWENPTTKPCTIPLQGIAVNSRIDTELLARQRDPEAFRSARAEITVRGMKKTVHDRIIYGNSAFFPDQINGLWTMYPNLTSGGVPVKNVTGNGGVIAGAQSSTWALKWGLDGVFFAYPRGGKDFIQIKDGGEQLVADSQTPPLYYWAMVTTFKIQFGLGVADPKNCQRLANIDTVATWGINQAERQLQAFSSFADDSFENAVLYAPRRVWSQMTIATESKSNLALAWGEAWGAPVKMVHTVPVRLCERLFPVDYTKGMYNPMTGAVLAADTTLYEPVSA